MVRAVFWSTKMATVICRITAWGQKPRSVSQRTNTWNSARAIKYRKPSGMNGVLAALSPHRVVMWSIWTYATWARKNCLSACHSSVNWQKLMSVLIQLKSQSLCAQPRITPWAASKPTSSVKPESKGCSLLVNVLLLVCTAQTVWAPTHWQNWWSLAVLLANKLLSAPWKATLPMVVRWMHRPVMWKLA
ncbi:Uncharacterised protein [Yersinia enterocolitica]|nr:Uncharacterised protein [Yersinia enterocolitica]